MERNGFHLVDDIFSYILVTEKFDILNRILLKFVPMGAISNKLALAEVRDRTDNDSVY